MQEHAVHSHVIWGWSRGDTAWQKIQEEVRGLYGYYETTPEADAQSTYRQQIDESNGKYGQIRDGETVRTWPGHGHKQDRYYVAVLGWRPGMTDWEWQDGTEVIPDGVQSSASDQAAASAAMSGILEQVKQMPVPEVTATATTKWNYAAIAVGVGVLGFALTLLLTPSET